MTEDDKKYWTEKRRDAVKHSTIVHLSSIKTAVEQATEELANASTPEEILRVKAQAMIQVLSSFPIDPASCPFCEIQHAKYDDTKSTPVYLCTNCTYARANGDCSKPGSRYSDLITALLSMRIALFQYAL